MSTCSIPKNLGGRKCPEQFLRECVGFAFVPDGANEVSYATLSAMTSDAVVEDINDANPSLRMICIEDVENYAPEKGDAKVHEFQSGNSIFIANGTLMYKGLISSGDPLTEKNINLMNNQKWRVFPLSVDGFAYETDADTKLKVRGLKIAKGSFVAKYIPSNGNDVSEGVEFQFKIDKITDWSLYRFASYSALGYNLAEVCVPLIQVDSITITNPTVAGFTATILDDRGVPISGLSSGSIAIYNETETATVTGVATESITNPGTYTVATATGVALSDVLTITVDEDGFDCYGVSGTATIPAV